MEVVFHCMGTIMWVRLMPCIHLSSQNSRSCRFPVKVTLRGPVSLTLVGFRLASLVEIQMTCGAEQV